MASSMTCASTDSGGRTSTRGNVGGGAAGPRDAILLVQPDGQSSVAADGMQSPNGSVVTDDGSTFIVAETSRARLTAFTIAADGSLNDRRVFASVPGRHPDGVCIDAEGAIWFGSPLTEEFVRVREGGEIVATIPTPGTWAIACDLGGPDGHTLFCITGHNSIANLDRVRPDRNLDRTSDADGAVGTLMVPVPGARRITERRSADQSDYERRGDTDEDGNEQALFRRPIEEVGHRHDEECADGRHAKHVIVEQRRFVSRASASERIAAPDGHCERDQTQTE